MTSACFNQQQEKRYIHSWSHPKKMKRQTANSEEGRKNFCDRRYWVTQLLASPTLSKA